MATSARWAELAALAGILLVAALFRLPALDRVPNGFFLDEASRGYDAYALVLTGRDQFGVPWPLFAEGLDDYTPTLYTLLCIPSVALLGLNVAAVRLPAALVGVATVGMTFLAGRAYFGSGVGIVAAGLLAIAPWHILPSRTGAEWVLLPLFTATGAWLLALGRRNGPALLAAGIVLGLGLYSYAFARLLIPLLVLGFAALWWRDLARRPGWAVAALAALLLLAVPLAQFGLTAAGKARLRAVVPLDRYPGLAIAPYAIRNWLSYFDPAFLIWGSEPTDHHRLRGFGPLLPWMAPLVVAAVVAIMRRPSRAALFWLWWLVAAPASAALHRESPSSVLLLGAIPAWQMVAALGTVRLVSRARAYRPYLGSAVAGLILLAAVGSAALAASALYVDYPVYAAADWDYGARETIAFAEANRADFDDVLVSDRLPAAHILVLFHARVDPATYQADPIHVRQPSVRSRGTIGQYQFGRMAELLDRPGRHLVWVTPDEERVWVATSPPLFVESLPDGRPAYLVYSVGER
jgi:4-amino-4-deoxy-L-arabinose transferase-like glycosyltransferase